MKPFLSAILFAAVALCVGCSTGSVTQTESVTPRRSSVLTTVGPLVAQVAQTRIAYAILERNPSAAPTLEAIATALDVIAGEATGTEITEALIRGWIAGNAGKWGLLPGEDELLVQGLIAARAALLQNANLSSIRVGDPQLKPWLDAVRSGIRAGVAAHKLRLAPRPAPLSSSAAPMPPTASTGHGDCTSAEGQRKAPLAWVCPPEHSERADRAIFSSAA